MLTLYISNTQLTLIAPVYFGNEVKWSLFHLPFESFDSVSCAEFLASIVKEKRLTGSTAVLAVSMDHVLFREVIWDTSCSDWLVYQSIKMNFSQYFPGSLSDEFWVDFEWMNLKDESFEAHPRLQVYAAPKILLKSYIAMAEYAGLKVKAVDIDALALGIIFRDLAFRPTHIASESLDRLKIGLLIEAKNIWLIECTAQGSVRLKKTIFLSEQQADFLNFFQAFVGEDLWDVPEIFYIGEPESISTVLGILKSRFEIKAYPIDPFKQFNFLSDLTDFRFIADYPLSLAVHCGLRARYGD